MRRFLGLFILFSMALCTLHAQNIDKAAASYQQFNLLKTQANSDDQLYTALLTCYEDYAAIITMYSPSTPAYNQAKGVIRELYPYLYNAAAYYSNHGQPAKALKAAQSYVDVALMPEFKNDMTMHGEMYPTMAYFAAANTYNTQDFQRAIKYLRAYLDTGVANNRQNVYYFLAKAHTNVQDYQMTMSVLNEMMMQFPASLEVLKMAINTCLIIEDKVKLQEYISKALELSPQDEGLLSMQGQLYEEMQDYQSALAIYDQLNKLSPNNLGVSQHLALNYYNMAVMNYVRSNMAESKKDARMYNQQADNYFLAAIPVLESVVYNTPNNVKYMTALATAYSYKGNKDQLDNINMKLANLGAPTVAVDVAPSLVAFSDNANASSGSAYAAGQAAAEVEAPLYSLYAKEYVEPRIRDWQAKDPYETIAEYQVRVTEETRKAKAKELLEEAEKKYIANYAQKVRIEDMSLKPYDADHEVFLVESRYGNIILPVPRANNEAKTFESTWTAVKFENPEFYINNDKLQLSGITFVMPTGKSYRYDVDKNLNYVETVVDVTFDPLSGEMYAAESGNGPNVGKQSVKVGAIRSDVDVNIPQNDSQNESLYAVVIANENYTRVPKVPFALHDGEVFAEYCQKTLGVPEKNVLLYTDASYGIMLEAMDKITSLASVRGGDMDVIFYYAGHGIPDESSRDAYLLPTDANGKSTGVRFSLTDIYAQLGAMEARSVMVFMDACFSGSKRDGGMVADARGVAIKPKMAVPTGNTIVFSAVSNDETAMPYKDKGHGMFTYFLLKKLQETKGDITLMELSEYVRDNVGRESILINDKRQTPTVSVSNYITSDWQSLKLNNRIEVATDSADVVNSNTTLE